MRKLCRKIISILILAGIGISAFGEIRVQFKDNDLKSNDNWMRLEFKIINDESASFDLTNSTLTYYFPDSYNGTYDVEKWSFLINSNQAQTSAISAAVTSSGSQRTLTIKFSSGIINAHGDAWVLIGVSNKDWTY